MVTPELTYRTARPSGRPLAAAALAVAGFTAAGAVLGVAAPRLAGHVPPHPALTGSLSDAAGILANNTRVLAAPYLIILLRLQDSRPGRRLGDLITTVVIASSTLPVGIAAGHWGTRLLSFIPQLPVEWAALATAASAWLTARTSTSTSAHASVARRAAVTASLLVIAAGLETWCTPHRPSRSTAHGPIAAVVRAPVPGVGGVVACAADSCAGQGQPLQGRTLPFPFTVVRFRTGHRPAHAGLHQPPNPHRREHQMNSCQLIGRLTADPTVTQRKDTTVGEFRLAVQRPKKGGEDNGADYVDITAFGRLAETVGEYVTKGRKVAVTGRLRHQEWDGENGRRQKIDVVADNVEFLDTRRDHTDTDTEADGQEVEAAAV